MKGRVQPLRIYECLDALPETVRQRRLRSLADFDAGRLALQAEQYDTARQRFVACLEVDPNDAAARLLLGRCGPSVACIE